MTVAPPQEVSTQVQLVFPFAPLAGYPDGSTRQPVCLRVVGAEQPGHDAGCQGEERRAHAGGVTDRSRRFVPLSHLEGWELLPGGLFRASPPLEFSGEARCLAQTWKRMKMEPSWGIREGGASETRSWRFGAPRPQVKLIQVRFPDG